MNAEIHMVAGVESPPENRLFGGSCAIFGYPSAEESMTPEQRIKRHILKEAIEHNDDLNWDGEITAENVDKAWQTVLLDNDAHWDYVSEFRGSGEDTELPSQWSRHYEAKEKARQLSDGTWVGWTYWYGGGKYGEPEAIDWMNEAYDVEVRQETRIVNVFAKKEVVA